MSVRVDRATAVDLLTQWGVPTECHLTALRRAWSDGGAYTVRDLETYALGCQPRTSERRA